jgi:hypothetical protein
MRSVPTSVFAYLVWLSGCGASTGLPLGTSEPSGADGTYPSEVGGSAFGGSYAEVGGLATGAIGGTVDVKYPTGGRSYATGGTRPIYATGTGGSWATGGAKAYPFGGAVSNTGGSYLYTGGAKATGGTVYSYSGGTQSTGGAKAYTGGASYSATGGAKSTGGAYGTGGATPTGSMKIANDGWANVPAGLYTLHGYIFSFAGGSSSSITLTYGVTSFCATGNVAANPTYISYAGAGFSVNQPSASSGGPADLLAINAQVMTVSFTNPGNSPLRIQMNDPANNNWCYDITNKASPITIPLAQFNTHCWDNSGAPFAPGTPITTIQLVVPGDSVVGRAYSFCLLGITFQ